MEEGFKGAMSSLDFRAACDQRFQAHDVPWRPQGYLHSCGQKQGQPVTAVTSGDKQGMAVVFWVVARHMHSQIPGVVPVAATSPVIPSPAQPWPGMEADGKLGPPGTSPNPLLHQAHMVRPPTQASGAVILNFSASE